MRGVNRGEACPGRRVGGRLERLGHDLDRTGFEIQPDQWLGEMQWIEDLFGERYQARRRLPAPGGEVSAQEAQCLGASCRACQRFLVEPFGADSDVDLADVGALHRLPDEAVRRRPRDRYRLDVAVVFAAPQFDQLPAEPDADPPLEKQRDGEAGRLRCLGVQIVDLTGVGGVQRQS
ncbi:hypothetical protein [Rhodopseudomonas palustris]|uniref:hypothetical protein n=1 Tax=Rhodopseudomonas palustris TaxID=1076 RepID=UPI001F226358|nr:hypothetical protein [Rhodopseudomonas palustris]